jgi:polyhydroxyalkanoate synthesis repressor PhaR
MVVIKRYPNRKLYDTGAKQYIALDGVAELIRQGAEIKVVDHASGEDLTAFTLTQIILEQEKQRPGFLTHSFLADLIRMRGERISVLKSNLMGPIHLWRQIDEEIKVRLQRLVQAGELTEKEANRLIEKLISPGVAHFNESKLNQDIEAFFARNRPPSREDLQRLNNQLDALSNKLAEMTDQDQSDASAPPSTF